MGSREDGTLLRGRSGLRCRSRRSRCRGGLSARRCMVCTLRSRPMARPDRKSRICHVRGWEIRPCWRFDWRTQRRHGERACRTKVRARRLCATRAYRRWARQERRIPYRLAWQDAGFHAATRTWIRHCSTHTSRGREGASRGATGARIATERGGAGPKGPLFAGGVCDFRIGLAAASSSSQ